MCGEYQKQIFEKHKSFAQLNKNQLIKKKWKVLQKKF